VIGSFVTGGHGRGGHGEGRGGRVNYLAGSHGQQMLDYIWRGLRAATWSVITVGWPNKWVSQDGQPFAAAGTKTNDAPNITELVLNLQEEFFTTRVMVFLLLLSIMSKFTTEENLQHNRHKMKFYNRKKPGVTVNIGWRSVIIIHDIINGIFIIIFTNISCFKTGAVKTFSFETSSSGMSQDNLGIIKPSSKSQGIT
jgi:hypothetical protein